MFDLIALWIGRVVLTLIGLGILFIIGYVIKIACRRPYYCIKFLLPWKRKTEKEWEELVEYFTKPTGSDFASRYNFSRWKQFGLMKSKNHKWWEPTHRFFRIEG